MQKETIYLNRISEENLLEKRICDLPIAIEGTWLQPCIDQLYRELNQKGLIFMPPCYLADEWLTPDGEPVVGIPFYLAHPRLMKLEKQMMLDVEGGTKTWCMQLLRHEAGHAINYAYKLYKRKKWQKLFGSFSQEYEDTYRFRPYSKSYVRHLEDYYAQYHPDEDFAETFAVWLTPHLDWRKRYKGWKALNKLLYVDALMKEIQGKRPLVGKGVKYWQVPWLRIKLKNFYKKKRSVYAEDFPDFHDANLKRIFVLPENAGEQSSTATEIIRRYQRDIRNTISAWTGEKKFIINQLLDVLVNRCKALQLRTNDIEPTAVLKITTYATTLIMNYMYTGKLRGEG